MNEDNKRRRKEDEEEGRQQEEEETWEDEEIAKTIEAVIVSPIEVQRVQRQQMNKRQEHQLVEARQIVVVDEDNDNYNYDNDDVEMKLCRTKKIDAKIISPIEQERTQRQQHQQQQQVMLATPLQAPNFIRRLRTSLSLPGAVAVPGMLSRQVNFRHDRASTPPPGPPSTTATVSSPSVVNHPQLHQPDILVSATIVQDDPTTAWWVAEASPFQRGRWKWMVLVSILVISLGFCVTIIHLQAQSHRSNLLPPINDGNNNLGARGPSPPIALQRNLSQAPTWTPSLVPTMIPTMIPSTIPTRVPSSMPSLYPSSTPTAPPSLVMSSVPSVVPSGQPSVEPSLTPSVEPSLVPSRSPSMTPSLDPTSGPTDVRQWTLAGPRLVGDGGGDTFGISVAQASGNANGKSIVAVGAYLADTFNGIDSGMVRVAELIDEEWRQLGQTIDGPGISNQAGVSVDLSADGHRLVVGAWSGGLLFEGLVRVYEYNPEFNVWFRLGQDLFGSKPTIFFGGAVSMSDDGLVVAVGADYDESNTGSVHVFGYSLSTQRWERKGDILYGPGPNSRLGWDVSLSGDGTTLAAGAPEAGIVSVFRFNDELVRWENLGEDLVGDGHGAVGHAVSLSRDGSMLAFGAYHTDSNPITTYASVYQWQEEQASWVQVGQSLVAVEGGYDSLGRSVSLAPDGQTVAVGGRMVTEQTTTADGAVLVFRYNSGQDAWTVIQEPIVGTTPNSGYALSLSDTDRLVVGSPDYGQFPFANSGQVQVYDLV